MKNVLSADFPRTFFAPPKRLSKEEITAQYHKIRSCEFVQKIFAAMPYLAIIQNKHRQIVFSNNALLMMFGILNISEILGQRPGEVIRCIHHKESQSGCGTSKNCRYCNAVKTVLESQNKKERVSKEARIISLIDGKEVHFDLLVTATPFLVNGEGYTIVAFNDISDQKRRRALERVFFHDLINSVGGLDGVIDYLIEIEDLEKIKRILPKVKHVTENLMDDIHIQRDLLAAENGDIKVTSEMQFCADVVKEVVQQIMYHNVAIGKVIIIDPKSSNVSFQTDSHLLKRILVNMLKNALEASPKDKEIVIGCYSTNQNVDFVVSNLGYIPTGVQSQLFQRSFSTKGGNRGLVQCKT